MIKVYYHSDLDGHCSGAIVKTAYPEAEMFPINYGYSFPWDDIKKDDTVYMVDFCLQPFSDMIKLKDMCNLTWIDHHKTALDEAVKNSFNVPGLRQDGVAACVLTWVYLFSDEEIPLAVQLLGEYDVWDHKDPATLPFQYGMRIRETDPQKDMSWWDTLLRPQSLWVTEIINEGKIIIAYENQVNAGFIKSYGFDTILSYTKMESVPNMSFGVITSRITLRAIATNRGYTSSKLFDSVWDENKYDLMITFCRLPSQKWTVSLYSTKPDIDCGSIAKRFGGGGHFSSAGFQCEELPFGY